MAAPKIVPLTIKAWPQLIEALEKEIGWLGNDAADDGDRVQIHNGHTIKEYEFINGKWFVRSTAYVK